MVRRHQVTRTIKVLIAHALYYTGVLQLYQRVALRRKAVVLMYHRVLTADERRTTGSHPGIIVDRQTFANQMAVLKRRFAVLSLDEFAQRMEGGVPFPDSTCLITFDDGWSDNFVNALPILRERGLPAVVFLPVNYIGARRLFWREALTHLLVEAVLRVRRTPSLRPRMDALLRPAGFAAVLDAPGDDPRPSVVDAIALHSSENAPALERLLRSVSAELGVDVEALQTPDTFIDWQQAELMSREGIAFGGHGAEHRLLTRVTAADAEHEIRTSRDMMRRTFNGAVPAFSYPNGNWNAAVAAKVKDSGYRLAFTTVPGVVRCGDDRLTVKRINIHESATDTTPMFLARVIGLF